MQHELARRFIEHETQFHLGHLVTEQPHPRTMTLSRTAAADPREGARQILSVDDDVIEMLRAWAESGQPERIADDVLRVLTAGGRVFFTGCGATGRLSILLDATWRRFWQTLKSQRPEIADRLPDLEDATRSVMAGGDFALIKSVEGYEDCVAFGKRQIADLGVRRGDLVFAITEGGETSFVIGTAWAGLEAGASVYFVYNNPDDVLARIQRSHEVICEPRIHKVCLATGPMAITGSTRMQATTAEMAALGVCLEMALQRILSDSLDSHELASLGNPAPSAREWVAQLAELLAALRRPENLDALARAVLFEQESYEAKGLVTCLADAYALDLLTDTTERSPTFLLPPFRKKGDETAAPSWCFLTTSHPTPQAAWRGLLRRGFNDVRWTRADVAAMLGEGNRFVSAFPKLEAEEILRFDVSVGGIEGRLRSANDGLVVFLVGEETEGPAETLRAYESARASANARGCKTAVFALGTADQCDAARRWVQPFGFRPDVIQIVVPPCGGHLHFGTHLALKLCLNTLSTLTMARMGRVLGNCMIWVSPSNKKLYDRAARYVAQLAGKPYADACDAVFHVMDDLRPRIAAGQEVPAPVLLACIRLLCGGDTPQAEATLRDSIARRESLDALFARLGRVW